MAQNIIYSQIPEALARSHYSTQHGIERLDFASRALATWPAPRSLSCLTTKTNIACFRKRLRREYGGPALASACGGRGHRPPNEIPHLAGRVCTARARSPQSCPTGRLKQPPRILRQARGANAAPAGACAGMLKDGILERNVAKWQRCYPAFTVQWRLTYI